MSGKYAMLTFIGMQFTGALIVKLAGFFMATLSYQWLVLMIKLFNPYRRILENFKKCGTVIVRVFQTVCFYGLDFSGHRAR